MPGLPAHASWIDNLHSICSFISFSLCFAANRSSAAAGPTAALMLSMTMVEKYDVIYTSSPLQPGWRLTGRVVNVETMCGGGVDGTGVRHRRRLPGTHGKFGRRGGSVLLLVVMMVVVMVKGRDTVVVAPSAAAATPC